MRYDFSSSFLVIQPPATSFGEAWELLCADLLAAEEGEDSIQRMVPPDRGIDIYNHTTLHAFQCKADEKGAAGVSRPDTSIASLRSAVECRTELPWNALSFCTNAPYSTKGKIKVQSVARELALEEKSISFLGPTYWNGMCEKFHELVRDRFYYRVTAREKDVIEAFQKAGYFKQYVDEYAESIEKHDFSVVITNNRTPVEIEIPFSPELTVENYLDVAKQLLGVTLEWTNYPDMGTSAGTNLSITVDQYAQTFSTKLGDLPINSGDPLKLWIKIVWKKRIQDTAPSDTQVLASYLHACFLYEKVEMPKFALRIQTEEPGKVTVDRHEALVQGLIWDSFHTLRTSIRAESMMSGELERRTVGVYQRDLIGLSSCELGQLSSLLDIELHRGDLLKVDLLREEQFDK